MIIKKTLIHFIKYRVINDMSESHLKFRAILTVDNLKITRIYFIDDNI